MQCPHCSAELSEGVNFCFECGFDLKKEKPAQKKMQEVNPIVAYGGYLAVGGWLTIITGAIIAGIIFKQADSGYGGLNLGIFLTGLAIFISTITYSWLYFGLHKAVLKISRIEQALGIDNDDDDDGMV